MASTTAVPTPRACSSTPPASGSSTPSGGPLDLPRRRPAELRPRARRRRWPSRPLAARVAHEARGRPVRPRATPTPTSGSTATTTGSPAPGSSASATSLLVLRYGDEPAPGRPGSTPGSDTLAPTAVYEQPGPRRRGGPARLVAGEPGERFEVRELGARYLVDLTASATSSGLFLDQRETRRGASVHGPGGPDGAQHVRPHRLAVGGRRPRRAPDAHPRPEPALPRLGRRQPPRQRHRSRPTTTPSTATPPTGWTASPRSAARSTSCWSTHPAPAPRARRADAAGSSTGICTPSSRRPRG